MRLYIVLITLLWVNPLLASKVVVNNASYANKSLNFYQFSDPITREAEKVFTLKLNSKGVGEYILKDIGNARQLFCDFGIYRGFFIVKNNSTVKLKLPPFKEKTINDKKNPFYQPLEFWFREEKGLNNQISDFDISLNKLINQNFNQLYYQQSRLVFDSIKVNLKQKYAKTTEKILKNNVNQKLALLDFEIFRPKVQLIAPILTDAGYAEWNHLSFIKLFDAVFNKKIIDDVQKSSKIDLPKVMYTKNVTALSNYVKQQYQLKGDLNKLVVLKLLYDGFYSNKFNNDKIEQMIASSFFSADKSQYVKKIASNILQKITFLKVGSKAPVICLKNLEDVSICTNSNNNKLKYILFADADIMINREQLKYLTELDKKFKKYIDFYVVLRPSEKEDSFKYLTDNQIIGNKLVDIEEANIKKYKIRTFPTAILLNAKHKVAIKNTKSPLDGFEHQFIAYLRKR